MYTYEYIYIYMYFPNEMTCDTWIEQEEKASTLTLYVIYTLTHVSRVHTYAKARAHTHTHASAYTQPRIHIHIYTTFDTHAHTHTYRSRGCTRQARLSSAPRSLLGPGINWEWICQSAFVYTCVCNTDGAYNMYSVYYITMICGKPWRYGLGSYTSGLLYITLLCNIRYIHYTHYLCSIRAHTHLCMHVCGTWTVRLVYIMYLHNNVIYVWEWYTDTGVCDTTGRLHRELEAPTQQRELGMRQIMERPVSEFSF